jgi:elongation factor G
VRVEISAPSSTIGDITGDLATKRARISGNDTVSSQIAKVIALVPLAELTDYQSRLKSLTGGEGAYAMEFSHYEQVPPRRQQELAQAWKPRKEEE